MILVKYLTILLILLIAAINAQKVYICTNELIPRYLAITTSNSPYLALTKISRSLWQMRPTSDGFFNLINDVNLQALDTRSYSNSFSFASVDSLDRQQWKLDGNKLVNKELVLDSNKIPTPRCLDVNGGLFPIIRFCNDAQPFQKWKLC